MVPVSERLLFENCEFSLRHYIWRGAFIFAAMSSAAHLDHAGRGRPTARQGKRRSLEKAEKAKAGGSAPDMPTSAKCRMARKYVEPPQIGKCK
jgi:hypothetical protein